MSNSIPQSILDSLTRVEMPKGINNRLSDKTISISDLKIPVHQCSALVVGSGAAGLRAAVELKRENVDCLVLSTSLFGGTSACSGSDKQTLHTAGTSNNGDNFNKLAADIGGGGCMDNDTAYIEAVGSINAFAGLQYIGLPLPQDRFGSVLRYQTDHDEVGRATSCGPRTSRLMVKVLCEEAIRLQIPFLREHTAVKILTDENDKVSGVIAIDSDTSSNKYGIVVIQCNKLVLASGGPGELYRDSVYPKFCFGSLGMAIEAGIKVTNLTESQFGIGTRRTEFPWNLSGTYVQVIPYIYSVDKEGNEHNFLTDYYRTTQELASNVFRKGYQWPFHAHRMLDYNSSIVDLAIFIESKKGNTILMDFNRNPKIVPGDKEFSLSELDDDVKTYLTNNDALQELPIDRLKQMNPLAIELYNMHGHDIRKTPLPFNVSNQHMNGGIDVDIWAHTSLEGCYAIGEVSGTHGVTRPGGAALNAGQVFGTRCAKHIASTKPKVNNDKLDSKTELSISNIANELDNAFANTSPLDQKKVSDEIQARMSEKAGFICIAEEVPEALNNAIELNKQLTEQGLSITKNKIAQYFQWQQTALTSQAVLTSLNHYIKNGGGSRGARAICSQKGTLTPGARNLNLNEYKFIDETDSDRKKKISLKFSDGDFQIEEISIREMEDPGIIFFEKNWSSYLTEEIYKKDYKH
jgi:succinate dehydrogenase / fumarate reductase, flavoprotein subunit